MKYIFFFITFISYCHEKISNGKEPKEIRIHFGSHCMGIFYDAEMGTMAEPGGSFYIACPRRK